MTDKSIDTLIPDIYALITGQGDFPDITDEQIQQLSTRLTDVISSRLKERKAGPREFSLRVSNYGFHPRKLWYEAYTPVTKEAKPDPVLYLKFMLGDIQECLLLFLAQAAGHNVASEQEEVTVEGIPGHIDCTIDDWLVDVKTASKWAFDKKFMNGEIFNGSDAFAYIPQISGYAKAKGLDKKAFLVSNKETGELALVKFPEYVNIDVSSIAANAKKVVASDTPPEEKCYPEEPNDTYGNMILGKDCSFCRHKDACWASANGGEGLRKYKYANGIRYFTNVVKPPSVEEVTKTKGFVYESSDYVGGSAG